MIKAAGGVVENHKNEILMMKRLGHWDLPKGKADPGENSATTAQREVEEECASYCEREGLHHLAYLFPKRKTRPKTH